MRRADGPADVITGAWLQTPQGGPPGMLPALLKRLRRAEMGGRPRAGAEHTTADIGVDSIGPVWTFPNVPISRSAAAHTSPTQRAATPMSSCHSSSRLPITRSIQTCAPGSRRTAPPPLRRLKTSTCRRSAASRSTSSIDCAEPRASADPRTASTRTERRASSGTPCAWNPRASPSALTMSQPATGAGYRPAIPSST